MAGAPAKFSPICARAWPRPPRCAHSRSSHGAGCGCLNPKKPLAIQGLTAQDRFRDCQGLVVIHHQRNVVRQLAPHRSHDGQVLFRRRPSQAQLDRAKSLLQERLGFIGRLFRRHKPKPVAVVGCDGPWLGPDIAGQWQSGGYGQRIPASHVEPCQRHADDALCPQQPIALRKAAREIDRRDAFAVQRIRDVGQYSRNQPGCHPRVAEQIGTPDGSFLGLHVDQKDRCGIHGLSARAQRPGHRNFDRPCLDRVQGQRRRDHIKPPQRRVSSSPPEESVPAERRTR